MRRLAITLASAAALTMVSALMWSADAQIERGPAALAARRKTSRPLKRPPAVLIGAGSAARGVTGSAAAGIAGAPPAERQHGLKGEAALAAPAYPVTSSARRPFKVWPYSPTASTTTG